MSKHPDPLSDRAKLRRFEEAELISNPNRWSSEVLGLKNQPWNKEFGSEAVFAKMYANIPLDATEIVPRTFLTAC